MRRFSQRRFLYPAAALLCALVLFSCTLKSFPPKVIIRVSAATGRDGPTLSAMPYFAIATSGSVSNTLASSQVGGRNLECLQLNGQIFFPYTLSQLTSGVDISLAAGAYRFTIVGFGDAAGATPSSLAQLYAQSPSLKAFVIAQGNANISTSQTVRLSSTYVSTGASDLLVTCPKPDLTLHSLFTVTNSINYLKYAGGSWSYQEVSPTAVLGNMYVDGGGIAHFSHSVSSPGAEAIRYTTNATGSFVSELVQTIASGSLFSDVARTEDGSVFVLTTPDSEVGYVRVYSTPSTGTWTPGASVLGPPSGNILELALEPGPGNRLMAVGTRNGPPANAVINLRNGAGVWGSEVSFTTAGAFACTTSSDLARGAIDPDGFAHVVYRCDAVGTHRLGYATNRSGSWVNTDVTDSGLTPLDRISFSIDPQGGLHLAIVTNAYIVGYLYGTSAGGLSGTQTQIYDNNPDVISNIAIGGVSATEAHLLGVFGTGGSFALRPMTNKTGSWIVGSSLFDTSAGLAGYRKIHVR